MGITVNSHPVAHELFRIPQWVSPDSSCEKSEKDLKNFISINSLIKPDIYVLNKLFGKIAI